MAIILSFWGGYLGAIISAGVAFAILYIQRKDNEKQYEYVWRDGVYHTGDAAYKDENGKLDLEFRIIDTSSPFSDRAPKTNWNNEEVNLAIVVKCPPTKKEVSDFLDEYLATHTGFDVCEHNLSAKFGYGEDVYLVLSEACDGIDYAPTISLFSPSIKVSKQREKKLKLLYEKYLINNKS